MALERPSVSLAEIVASYVENVAREGGDFDPLERYLRSERPISLGLRTLLADIVSGSFKPRIDPVIYKKDLYRRILRVNIRNELRFCEDLLTDLPSEKLDEIAIHLKNAGLNADEFPVGRRQIKNAAKSIVLSWRNMTISQFEEIYSRSKPRRERGKKSGTITKKVPAE